MIKENRLRLAFDLSFVPTLMELSLGVDKRLDSIRIEDTLLQTLIRAVGHRPRLQGVYPIQVANNRPQQS